MVARVKVGCCGWALKGGMDSYFKSFKVIELQSTFYKLPKASTAKGWRLKAPKDFEFTVKAWQAITHPATSPTWRKAGIKIPASKAEGYGHLKPSEENFEAWSLIRKICEELNSKIVLVQCPPTFNYTVEHVKNMEKFFLNIDRGGLAVAWEPRGDWSEHQDKVKELCESLNLIHAVDIMRREPALINEDLSYIRLHGLGGREVNYRYKYTDDDLRRLLLKVEALSKISRDVYVMFNNIHMAEDSLKFKGMVDEPSLEAS